MPLASSILHIWRACVSRQLLMHHHELEHTKFEIIVILNTTGNKIIKTCFVARRMCEVEGEGVVNERVA